MRYGIFSDVHGNLEALDIVLNDLAEKKVERTIFLGDAVGYGADPEAVISRIRQIADVSIMGNHDLALVQDDGADMYYEAARQALAWCRQQLSDSNRDWLAQRPFKVREKNVEFCHGAPVAPEAFEYLFTVEQAESLVPLQEQLAMATFIGHSHLPVSFCLDKRGATALTGPKVRVDPDKKTIMTVGSVGQPRDRDPRACYGIFDGNLGTFEYHRLAYDVVRARQKILDAGLAPIFADRLLMGV